MFTNYTQKYTYIEITNLYQQIIIKLNIICDIILHINAGPGLKISFCCFG